MRRASRYQLLALAGLTLLPGCGQEVRPPLEDSGVCCAACPEDKSDDFLTAMPLAQGQQHTGTICPRLDRDVFMIVVPSGHDLLAVHVKYAPPVPALNLRYHIYTLKEALVASSPPGGPGGIEATHRLEPGSYYLVIQDDLGTGFDMRNPFVLSYSTASGKDGGGP